MAKKEIGKGLTPRAITKAARVETRDDTSRAYKTFFRKLYLEVDDSVVADEANVAMKAGETGPVTIVRDPDVAPGQRFLKIVVEADGTTKRAPLELSM